jgi:hypothetical protein
LELLGGAVLPIQMNLQVEITRRNADSEPSGLPAELLEQEDKLLSWLSRSPARRAEFLADPVKSLQAAGIKLDDATLATLAERHRGAAAADVVPPGLTIRSLAVKVAPAPKRPPQRKPAARKKSRGA